ncbi:AAA family ATPase [Nocardioides sp.]|uniref:AAA family ATPase n=1 Tax=Nocardioides sp. TaxID=35761 RepID=UPI00261E174A|nr:AAA family ATPase [Nocardioides sp.]MCW2739196.1 hypothetical protein [Nocardioides sp.]
MSALPRPDVRGPSRALNDALHDLHHRAGWPSLRTLARETGVSHTTVSKAFSRPALPTWGTLELLVEAMGGDTGEFHALWLAASTPTDGVGDGMSPAPRIAGRRAELAAVRTHLETASGLLLVTGEAGIGKTRLVTTAARASAVRVAWGSCLPLSNEIPLLPVADCIRSLRELDIPAFDGVLSRCPSYVAESLATLVPEVGPGSARARTEDRGLLFSALVAALRAMADQGRVSLFVEDLHWSDPATLDFIEHLVTRGLPVPVLGTWRSDDLGTPDSSDDWRTRMGSRSGTTVLALGPLSRRETAEQLALLGADAHTRLDTIHGRSQGLPLFTEQLAAHLDEDAGLPSVLADLLDRRLLGIDETAWSVVRGLGLAERPLPPAPLAAVSGLDQEQLTRVLRDLRERRLLRPNEEGNAQLQHPLLAEAVQRRLVAGEGVATHRKLAQALAEQPEAEAAEVAEHWRRAGDDGRELDWRIAAARGAAARFDRRQEADHWLRVLEIWPTDGVERGGDPAVRRADVYLRAMDSLRASFRFDEAAALSEAAETALAGVDLDAGDRADLLFRRSIFRGEPEGFESGLALLEEALAVHETLPVREGKVRALDRKQNLLFAMGRSAESRAVAYEEVDAARQLGDPILLRDALMRVAWHVGIGGELHRGQALLARAGVESGALDDPLGDVRCGVYATDMFLTCGAPADDVVTAGRPALDVARAHDLDNPQVMLVRVNVAFSLLRGGRVADAEDVIATPADAPFELDRWPLHTARAVIDSRRGLSTSAMDRLEEIWTEPSTSAPLDLEFLAWASDVAWWAGAAEQALTRLVAPLVDVAESAAVRLLAPTLVVAARVAAGVDDRDALARLADVAGRSGLLDEDHRTDPHLAAHRVTFAAELASATSEKTVERWAAAAAAWVTLRAPHDAAYCRWQGAQAASRVGQGTVAARLLKRAAREAREHVPLSEAIARTAQGIAG